jgi:hypothetical protein
MHVQPTNESGREFLERELSGPVTMLNLLRFRETADYTSFPELAPDEPISGRNAYDRYVAHTLPFLVAAGGEIEFLGEGGPYLIGPEDERWDLVMLVRHPSVQAFIDMADDADYLSGIGHRVAALEDSRLLPIEVGHPARGADISGTPLSSGTPPERSR